MILQATVILFIVFFCLLLIGVPISVGIGMASIATALFNFDLAKLSYIAAQRSFAGIDSFALLAIPFFMLAGNIMNKGGIAKRLVRLARLLVSNIPGYLAHTNVVANMFFGAVSGSAVAAASAIGSIMTPIEKEENYDPAFSAAVNICSAPTGIIIPPSGPLILYSLTAGGVSVSALFVAGIIPGILLGIAVMIGSFYFAKKLGHTDSADKETDSAFKIIIDAIPSLFMTVIVMAGILGGVFTATEAGVVAVIYCLILALLYREVNFKDLYDIFANTMMSSATILFLISASSIMSYVMSFSGIPAAISTMLLSLSNNKYVLMLIMNVFLLVLGTFLDLTPAVLIFTPIFLPIAKNLGMNPVHFGIMLILNLGIGSVTPPVGSCLFVGCGVAKVSIEKVTKYIIPIFFLMVIVLFLVTYIPALSLLIPKLMNLV